MSQRVFTESLGDFTSQYHRHARSLSVIQSFDQYKFR